MIAKDKPIEADDFNNDLVGIKEETEPHINTETEPEKANRINEIDLERGSLESLLLGSKKC